MKVETERMKADTALQAGEDGEDIAKCKSEAIADMINNPAAEKVLTDYLTAEEDEEKDENKE